MMTETIRQLTDALNTAFHNLGLDVRQQQLEYISGLIQRGMTAEGRYYHTPEHALALTDANMPIQSLAALFHDLVYYQVDGKFSDEVWRIIQPYLLSQTQDGSSIKLVEDVPAGDLTFHLVKEIFGFSTGQKLYTNGGSNEFLSALVMAKILDRIVSNKTLLQIIAEIEASIPFRAKDHKVIGPFEHLAKHLSKISHDYDIPFGGGELTQTIQEAVIFANKDVGNFAERDTATFLESTWKLLPEFNIPLRKPAAYSLQDYRQALQGMDRFLLSIRAEDVFHQYAGIPTQAEIREKLANVRRNLRTGSKYIEFKIFTLAILEALANVSGGDVSISTFLGDVAKSQRDKPDLESFLPAIKSVDGGDGRHNSLYHLLRTGRQGPIDFADVKTAPLALFIYHHSTDGKIHSYLEAANKMFTGGIRPAEFLQVLEPSLLIPIAEACAKMAPSRADRLIAYTKERVQ